MSNNSISNAINSDIFQGNNPDPFRSEGVAPENSDSLQPIRPSNDREPTELDRRLIKEQEMKRQEQIISTLIGTTFGLLIVVAIVVGFLFLIKSQNFNTSAVLFSGMLLIILGVINSRPDCPEKQIEYRFVPRTFKEEQENPVRPTDIFQDLFNKPSPWVLTFGENSSNFINRRYISQA